MKALKKNDTWVLSDLAAGKKTVGCKWVFIIKFKVDGKIERYKARLVAKGYTQTYGLDYQETFAPAAKMNTIRTLLSLAAQYDWFLNQLDVKNAFLHGNLEEEVFMDAPPGFENTIGAGKVCKLKKSLYGLKQSPRTWFEKFTKSVHSKGFHQSQGDHTLFFKHGDNGKIAALVVYDDDIILMENDENEARRLKEELNKEFEIKDLGNLRYFLGIEVARSRKGILISQRKYVLDLLKEIGMLGCKDVETPIEANHKVETTMREAVNRESYQRLVGKLIYLSHTCPDISHVVGIFSHFIHNPNEEHLKVALRIEKYLKNSLEMGLLFTKAKTMEVEIYTDADWADSSLDRKSISGYCSCLGGNLVTWRSKKKSVVARSSVEAKFRSMDLGICEGMWIKSILEDLNIGISKPMKLYCDNKAAISMAHNPVQHDRTKHVEIDKHFIKEKLESGIICIPYVPSDRQIVVMLTKGLVVQHFLKILSRLEVKNIFEPA